MVPLDAELRPRGVPSFGFELNPLLHFVCETSLEWSLDAGILERCLGEIEQQFRALAPRLTLSNLDQYELAVPSIHNPLRWWREDVLLQLLALKKAVLGCSPDQRIESFFKLALAAVLVPQLSNVTLGRLQLHFIDRTTDDINVWRVFSEHANAMVSDMGELRQNEWPPVASVHRVNSTDLAGFTPGRLADVIVTSPPYPNRYSYVWNTRPHLYFLDLLKNAKHASDLDKLTIGGT